MISLFRGPFSLSTAAKVLSIDPTEAIVQPEGLVASQIISVIDEKAKERKYDIHPGLSYGSMLTVSRIMEIFLPLAWKQKLVFMNSSSIG